MNIGIGDNIYMKYKNLTCKTLTYKTFIKDSLQNNGVKSLKKSDSLTQKLANKDKKFNKYLLSNNQNLSAK